MGKKPTVPQWDDSMNELLKTKLQFVKWGEVSIYEHPDNKDYYIIRCNKMPMKVIKGGNESRLRERVNMALYNHEKKVMSQMTPIDKLINAVEDLIAKAESMKKELESFRDE